MTQKELLYLEDAIGHEENIISILEETIKMLHDEKLKSFLNLELNSHVSMKEKLLNTLEVKANG